MKTIKKTLFVKDTRKELKDKDQDFLVVKVINSTQFLIDEFVSEATVKNRIENGWTVNIT